MGGINLNLSPSDLGLGGSDNAQAGYANRQRKLDNAWRKYQFRENKRRYEEGKRREDTRITRLLEDAKRAGVSPLAALGAGGSSPASISMPVGQGGRVSGTYQRKSEPELAISMAIMDESEQKKAKTKVFNQQAELLYWQTRSAEDAWSNARYDSLFPSRTIDPLYVRALDNTPSARLWKDQGYIPLVNPEFNLEPPETIGGAYWLAPRTGGDVESQPYMFMEPRR